MAGNHRTAADHGTLSDRSSRAVLDHAVFIAVVATVMMSVASIIWLVWVYFA